MDKQLKFLLLFCSNILLICILGAPMAANALELEMSNLHVVTCPEHDSGRQPENQRSSSADCYILNGSVFNRSNNSVQDADVFARLLDASDEPVLPNRTRIGSIIEVPPGESPFSIRLSIPAGSPGPFHVNKAHARGYKTLVRRGTYSSEDILPLEKIVQQ